MLIDCSCSEATRLCRRTERASFEKKPGDIVVMDNLGSHNSAALRRVIKVACAQKRTVEDAWRHAETALSAASKIKDYSDGARKPELRRTAW